MKTEKTLTDERGNTVYFTDESLASDKVKVIYELGKIQEIGYYITDDDFHVRKCLYVKGKDKAVTFALHYRDYPKDMDSFKEKEVVWFLAFRCLLESELMTDERIRMNNANSIEKVIDILRERYPVKNPIEVTTWKGREYLY